MVNKNDVSIFLSIARITTTLSFHIQLKAIDLALRYITKNDHIPFGGIPSKKTLSASPKSFFLVVSLVVS